MTDICLSSGAVLDGAEVEVTLAKPVDKDAYLRSPRPKHQFTTMPAFGFVPVDQYGTILPAFYPGYYSPPKLVECTATVASSQTFQLHSAREVKWKAWYRKSHDMTFG